MQKDSFYREILKINDNKLVDNLSKITEMRHLHKGEILIHEGEIQEKFVFLLDGILRGFFLDIKGRDITDCFGYQCGTPGMSCFTNRAPSPISIEALTECKLLQISGDALMGLMKESTKLLWIYNELLQSALRSHWEMKTMICQHTAMERYQWFLQAYPGLVKKVNGKHIASFLGMNPVTLSRLKHAL